jgi:hypothetical protein
MTKSLWPNEISVASNEVAPVTILREQASLLGEKTQNLVIAKVDSRAGETRDFVYDIMKPLINEVTQAKQLNSLFHDIFYLVAPALDNYRFELFRVTRSVEQFYPIRIHSDTLDMQGREIASEDELLKVLAGIFSHPKTMKIIESILIQSGWSPEEVIPS